MNLNNPIQAKGNLKVPEPFYTGKDVAPTFICATI